MWPPPPPHHPPLRRPHQTVIFASPLAPGLAQLVSSPERMVYIKKKEMSVILSCVIHKLLSLCSLSQQFSLQSLSLYRQTQRNFLPKLSIKSRVPHKIQYIDSISCNLTTKVSVFAQQAIHNQNELILYII